MNIDIANMALSIGEKTEGIDWGAAIVTFGSVFFGALLAYYCSKLQDQHNDKKKRAEAYDNLLSQVSLLTTELFKYKEIYFDKVKQAYDKDDYLKALLRTYDINMTLNPDLDKCYFISGYNKCFLTEISHIKDIGKAIETGFKQYSQRVDRLSSKLNSINFKEEFEILKYDYYDFYKDYEALCVRLYCLNLQLLLGYEKFFNKYYTEGLTDNYQLEINIRNHITTPESEFFLKNSLEVYNQYWCVEPNVFCIFCLYKRKLKYKIRGIRKYFCKPNICKTCRLRKIKVEKK